MPLITGGKDNVHSQEHHDEHARGERTRTMRLPRAEEKDGMGYSR